MVIFLADLHLWRHILAQCPHSWLTMPQQRVPKWNVQVLWRWLHCKCKHNTANKNELVEGPSYQLLLLKSKSCLNWKKLLRLCAQLLTIGLCWRHTDKHFRRLNSLAQAIKSNGSAGKLDDTTKSVAPRQMQKTIPTQAPPESLKKQDALKSAPQNWVPHELKYLRTWAKKHWL